jgi:diguanylate cyclase (GGDEF)-like protein
VVAAIREAVSQLAIEHAASAASDCLTVSVGGATLTPHSGELAAALFDAADAHLYRAKRAGRNRVQWREG